MQFLCTGSSGLSPPSLLRLTSLSTTITTTRRGGFSFAAATIKNNARLTSSFLSPYLATITTNTTATARNSMFRLSLLQPSPAVTRQLHHRARLAPPLVARSVGSAPIFSNNSLANNNINKIPLTPLLYSQMGAISNFSSLGGGGSRPPHPRGGGSRVAQGVGLLGAASLLLGKTKYLLAALKFTKLASLGSMALSIGTYSMFFGFPYAFGMVMLIAVHEAGHAIVMHHKGIPFSPTVFIPFMGAVIATKQLPRDAWEDAVIAYGGPALGSLGAGVVAIAAHATDSQLLYALADLGFMINLINLLPIASFDGGRVCGAISPWFGVAGIGLGGMLAYTAEIQNPLFYLLLISGGYETLMRFYDPSHYPPNYYRIPTWRRGAIAVAYFGLVAALLAAMDANQKYRKPPEVLMQEQLEKTWDMR